jgi:hypothetical protein
MLLEAKLRLTSPFLGEKRADDRGIRRLLLVNGNVAIRDQAWKETWDTACRHTQIRIAPVCACQPCPFPPATIHLFRRCYNATNADLFESFRKGTVLTLSFLLDEQIIGCPSPEQVKTLYGFVGEHLGISQWGSKFGFGRFQLISITPKEYGATESDSNAN